MQLNKNSPIIIGGVGGSGTRVVAEIMRHSGVFLGNNLTDALDNLWFTALFKRHDLFEEGSLKPNKAEIMRGLDIFTAAMVGGIFSSVELLNRVLAYTQNISENSYYNNEFEDYIKDWPSFIHNIVFIRESMDDYAQWGFKEPNSHIFLEELSDYYCTMKYVHVVRNGLDMAYSKNQIQFNFWGEMFGVRSLSPDHDPENSFRYWTAANQRAINIGGRMLEDRFLLLRYESLCNSPKAEIKRLADFADLSLSHEALTEIIKIPSPQPSIDRYKKHDISWLNDEDTKSLCKLGYTI
jgi:hypothetical protein